jgi:hypothetical protein
MRFLRACAASLRARGRLAQAAAGVVLAAPLLGGGWLLLRDSSLLSFPGGRAGARLPVAVLFCGGESRVVTAGGVVLGSRLASPALPVVPCSREPLTGGRVRDARVLSYLTVMGAAPAALAHQVQRLYSGPYGVTALMRDGLLVYFGGSTRPHAKWDSLATVLADPGAAGAAYIDVRLPERPAAGASQSGLLQKASASSTITPGSTGTSGSVQPQVSASDPASAALAASLEQAVGGGNAANATAAPSAPSSAPATTSPPPSSASNEPAAPAEPSSGSQPQAPSAGAQTPGAPTETGG